MKFMVGDVGEASEKTNVEPPMPKNFVADQPNPQDVSWKTGLDTERAQPPSKENTR